MLPRTAASPLPAYREGSRSRSVSPGTTLSESGCHESKYFTTRGIWYIPEAGGLTDSYQTLPNISNIQGFLENIDKTLSVEKPEQADERPQIDQNWWLNSYQRDLGTDCNLDAPNALPRDIASPGYRERGLSVQNVQKLNLAWEEKGGGINCNLGSSVATLNSGGLVRREVKFTAKGDCGIGNEVEQLSMFHDTPEDDDDISTQFAIGVSNGYDDARNKLGATTHNKSNDDLGEDATLESDKDHLVYDKGAAVGLAEDLRRLSLSLALEDILIPDTFSQHTWSNGGLDRDIVGGLPAWEFSRADLALYISGPAELEQQEALFDAYEQGLSPEVLNRGRDDDMAMVGSHLFVFDKVQRRGVIEEEVEILGDEIFEGLDDSDDDNTDEL